MTETLPTWQTHDVTSLLPFAGVRLVAFDVDGTLLTPSESHVFETIRSLQRSLLRSADKVHVMLATGRTLEGLSALLRKWAIPRGTPLILYNGSIVVANSTWQLLRAATLGGDSLRRILSISSGYDVIVLAYFFASPGSVPWMHGPGAERVFGWSRGRRYDSEFNRMRVTWQDAWGYEADAAPAAVLIDINDRPEIGAILAERLGRIPDVSATRSGERYIELRPAGVNKGTALQFVAKQLGIPRQSVLAVGDSDNDAEMAEWAGIGVSVANATPAALQRSDFVCRHGVARGAVELLRLIKHSRRFFPREGQQQKETTDDARPNRILASRSGSAPGTAAAESGHWLGVREEPEGFS